MSNPQTAPPLNPFAPMLESMDFLKQAWQSMSLPSTFVPTLDLKDLDKRINELRTVEQWLNVNLGMLRSTIQGLEVQRGTVATMQALGRAVVQSGDAFAQAAQAARGVPASGAPDTGTAADARPAMQAAAEPPDEAWPDGEIEPFDGPDGGQASAAGAGRNAEPATAPGPAALSSDPAMWWNLLQTQFNQLASSASQGLPLPFLGGFGVPAPAPIPASAATSPEADVPHGRAPAPKARSRPEPAPARARTQAARTRAAQTPTARPTAKRTRP